MSLFAPVTSPALRVAPRDHPLERAARGQFAPRTRGAAVAPLAGPLALSGGEPLQAADRNHFERRLDHDFGSVRLHADERSATLAAGLHAQAFTSGTHIGFGAGSYRPGTPGSRALLGHELVHVAQVQAAGAGSSEASMLWRAPEDEDPATDVPPNQLWMTVTTNATEAPSTSILLYRSDQPVATDTLSLYEGDVLTLKLRAGNGRVLKVQSDTLPPELARTDLSTDEVLMLRLLAPAESVTLRLHDAGDIGVSAKLTLSVGPRPAPQGTVDPAWTANQAATAALASERGASRAARRAERKALRGAERDARRDARKARRDERRDERQRARALRSERGELMDQAACSPENQQKIDVAQRRGVQVCDAALAALAASPQPTPAAQAGLANYMKLASTATPEGKAQLQQVIDVLSTARNSLAGTGHAQFRCADCEDETHGASVAENRRGGMVTICQLWRVGNGLKFDLAPTLDEARAYALVHEFVHLSGITARGQGQEAYVSDSKAWLALGPAQVRGMADAYAAVAWAAASGKTP